MPAKEFTLEELIANQKQLKADKISKNLENIAKMSERAAAAAEGAEKDRLEGLVKLHQDYKVELEALDPIAIATERFNKLKDIKPIVEAPAPEVIEPKTTPAVKLNSSSSSK